jgi:hypothetical protein
LVEEKYLPTFVISDKIKYVFEMKILGKVPVAKNLMQLITIKIFGEMAK